MRPEITSMEFYMLHTRWRVTIKYSDGSEEDRYANRPELYLRDAAATLHQPQATRPEVAAIEKARTGFDETAEMERLPPAMFTAVGYVNRDGSVSWEPNMGPGDLNPGQLIYVSRIPSRGPQSRSENNG